MTTQIGSTQQPTYWWHPTDEMLEKWLKDRQALLVLYYQLFNSPNKPIQDLNTLPIAEFCEALIDYVSYGHFRVFEKLAEAENRAQGEFSHHAQNGQMNERLEENSKTALNKDLIVNILRTTLCALDFNDKYAEHVLKNAIDFEQDLSALGEQLANRLDWEDVLVQQYLSSTQVFRLPFKRPAYQS